MCNGYFRVQGSGISALSPDSKYAWKRTIVPLLVVSCVSNDVEITVGYTFIRCGAHCTNTI